MKRKLAEVALLGLLGLDAMLVSGAVRSILMVAVLDPPVLPLLPALSVAVHETLWLPSPVTVRDAEADVVFRPVIVPTEAPLQLIAVTLLPPVVVSLVVTVPETGEELNQPDAGIAKLTLTTGGWLSALTV